MAQNLPFTTTKRSGWTTEAYLAHRKSFSMFHIIMSMFISAHHFFRYLRKPYKCSLLRFRSYFAVTWEMQKSLTGLRLQAVYVLKRAFINSIVHLITYSDIRASIRSLVDHQRVLHLHGPWPRHCMRHFLLTILRWLKQKARRCLHAERQVTRFRSKLYACGWTL